MVALFPVLSFGLTTLTAVFFLYPRLPQYSFQVRSVIPKWYNELGFRAKLGARVQLKNDNYMTIDIHALSFDLYYPDWFGNVQLLGSVQDARQLEVLKQTGILPDKENSTSSNETMADWIEEWRTLLNTPPLWHMEPRKHFETRDSVLMTPVGGLSVVSNLGWDMMKQWGVIQLQSTGAVHIKANSQMPLTLNILCDNLLDAWSLEMQGIHCELDHLDVGWKDIPAAMEMLRGKLLRPRSELTEEVEKENLKSIAM